MRRAAILLFVLSAFGMPRPVAAAPETYAINQTFGTIAFKVRNFGLFSSSGTFARFSGSITIDEAHPENTRVAVVIATGSVMTSWMSETMMLRSAPYFDVTKFPAARFTSTRVAADAANHYKIEGLLEIRGITQPIVLHAALMGEHPAPVAGKRIADFVVTGMLFRSMFGMTDGSNFISDRVDLRIDARVLLDGLPHAG